MLAFYPCALVLAFALVVLPRLTDSCGCWPQVAALATRSKIHEALASLCFHSFPRRSLPRPGQNHAGRFAYRSLIPELPFLVSLAEKAQAVYAQLSTTQDNDCDPLLVRPILVLGADTTVVAPNGEILGKPIDTADATRMLRLLSGATHQVITGVAVVAPGSIETAAEVTHVTMLTISEAEIADYIATNEPMDKAGAYAIQGRAARWIPRIHGCYFNVVGLPLALVAGMIEGTRTRLEKSVRTIPETAAASST